MDEEELTTEEISDMMTAEAADRLDSNSHESDVYKARYKGHKFGRKTTIAVAFWMMIITLLLVFKGCGDDDESASDAPRASTPPTEVLENTTVAPTTTESPTTTAPTTTAAPSTTAAATTTTAAIAPETIAAYAAASDYHDESLHQIEPDLQVAGLQVYCDEAAAVDAQFIQDLNTTTFGAAVQPLVNTLVGALNTRLQIEKNCAAAQSEDAAIALWNEPSTIDAHQATIDADAAVRSASGLPPLAV